MARVLESQEKKKKMIQARRDFPTGGQTAPLPLLPGPQLHLMSAPIRQSPHKINERMKDG
jgi:hypothetical protein